MRNLLKRMLAGPAVVRALGRRGRARSGPQIVVLMYHDLCADGDFDNWLRVPVGDFEQQLATLRGLGRFITPDEAAYPAELDPAGFHFLVTFDDGYVGNLELALPVLERYGVPAMFFVSTHHMETGEPFWSDIVVTAVQGAELTDLDLREFGLGEYGFRTGDPNDRWTDIERLLVALKTRGDETEPAVTAVLAELERRHGEVLAIHLPRYRPLKREEVARLDGHPLCRVGSHSHHHRPLTGLDDASLADNLRRSRRELEEICGRPVTDLAYPNGDHDAKVIAAARGAGYDRAYTVAPGFVAAGSSPLELPRLSVGGVEPFWLLNYRMSRLMLRDRGATERPGRGGG